ncbi:hypothetical protein AMTR_s00055p00193740 [Amborella trichopoda]|uniref:Aminotransferase-like plant mobile domain-containing protein n=1 Tax=Amborella trichopoda TaxID=13333 RepID=U5D797_AMBTC|nr:hypothetical protein AMTR_s00055p00193740 [Amborella trichopoda]
MLGLVVDGEPVTCHPISDYWKFIEKQLDEVPTGGNLKIIKHSWLNVKFRQLPPDAGPLDVLRYALTYLLFLISVTIFLDTSQAAMPTRYLQFFEDIEEAEVLDRVTKAFEILSKYMLVDLNELEVRMANIHCQINEGVHEETNAEEAHDELKSGVVGECNRAVEDMAPSTQSVAEECKSYNTRKK